MTRKLAPLSAANLSRGLRRLSEIGEGGLIPASATVRSLEIGFRHSSALASMDAQTVLHGDPHPANTYALPDDHTGFYDWQLARTGNWSHDVGYFLAGSLDIDDRRDSEAELLTGYLAALSAAGVAAPTFDDAWSRYRATPVYGLTTWIHTISAGSFQPLDSCVATIRRFAAAYDDLETAATLPG
jgi:aminoglycoside phosphotransferase (APT) family kinase protein